jgi:hypothetical protein
MAATVVTDLGCCLSILSRSRREPGLLQAPGPLGVTAGLLAETIEIASLIPFLMSGAAAGITGA